MEVESLAGLEAAFEAWRRGKRHPREAVPAVLLKRARQAARVHGPAAVSRVTKVDRGRGARADLVTMRVGRCAMIQIPPNCRRSRLLT